MNTLLLKTVLGAALCLGLVVGGWAAYSHVYASGNRAGYARAAAEAALATAKLQAKWQKEKDDAVKDAELRAAASAAAAAALRTANERMSSLLSSATQRIATAPADAVRAYAVTANAVLSDCERRYSSMAAAADGHANDVRTLMLAWPK